MAKEDDGRSGIKCRRCDYDYPLAHLQTNSACPVCDAPRPMRTMPHTPVPAREVAGTSLVA
jgi:hypothetical protein